MKKLLVISHEAARSGAPIVLLDFLEALKRRKPELIMDIILAKGGALADRFQNLGRTIQLDQFSNKLTFSRRIIRKIKSKINPASLPSFDHPQLTSFVKGGYDVILSNTIVNGYILNTINPKNCKVVSYIHELEPSIQRLTSPESLSYVLKYTNHFLVPSKAVMDNLVNNHKVPGADINLLPSYIPEVKVDILSKNEIVKKLDIDGYMIVGGMGTIGWTKGTDIFLQVCLQLKEQHPDIKVKFLWVGVNEKSAGYDSLIYDIKNAGLQSDIILVEPVNNPINYLSVMDVFLLSSREDSYPLVILEAAMQKKPVICFDKAGGTVEFNKRYGGVVVPYLNIVEMAQKLVALLNNKKEIERLGENAWGLYKELHSEENSLPVLETVLGI